MKRQPAARELVSDIVEDKDEPIRNSLYPRSGLFLDLVAFVVGTWEAPKYQTRGPDSIL